MMREIGKNGRYACPCCGYATLNEKGGFDICEICFWEDDGQDDQDADLESGPNQISLTEGRKNFIKIGVSEVRMKNSVRKPNQDDEVLREYLIDDDSIVRVK